MVDQQHVDLLLRSFMRLFIRFAYIASGIRASALIFSPISIYIESIRVTGGFAVP